MEQTPRGEDWYYRFSSLKMEPTSDSGTTIDPVTGERSNYATASLTFSDDTAERPVHVSAEGFVVRPMPDGKVVK